MYTMRNSVIIGIIIVAVLGTSSFAIKTIQRTQSQSEPTQTLTKVVAPTQEPSYSIEIKSPPTLNSYGFTYTATLKNILVTPFVTNFGLSECNFDDGSENKYSGMLSDNNIFQKAILPNESREFTAKDVTVNISGLEHTTEGLRKCSYNERGENVCELINDLKIIDCTGYISTDGKGAGGVYGGSGGQFPVKVVFP